MNEKDLEERLRSVTQGPQPSTPPSLRHFLREMPEAQAARHAGPLGWLRRIGDGVVGTARGICTPVPLARRAQLAAMLSIAVVVGVVGAGLMLSVREAQPLSSNPGLKTSVPTVTATPPRAHPETAPPLVVLPSPDTGIVWHGALGTDNENEALPTSAVVWPAGGYMGVSVYPYGQNGLVHSDATGLYWDWSPASDVAPDVTLTSIASDNMGRIVVSGYTQGIDGTRDGRIYYSDDGGPWRAIDDESILGGTPVQVVVRSPTVWVALGWVDNTPAGAVRPIIEWYSSDGLTWQRPAEPLPVKGNWAYVAATAYGFILSGTPIKTGSIREAPIWHSTDGQTWVRSVTTDNTALLLQPMISMAVNRSGLMMGVCTIGGRTASEGMSTLLLQSLDNGTTWSKVPVSDEGVVDAGAFEAVAAMGNKDGPFIAINGQKTMRVYMSTDGGQHWSAVQGEGGVRLLASKLVTLGDLNQTEYVRVLAFGEPYESLPIWVAMHAGH
jgi:hypothetical protein